MRSSSKCLRTTLNRSCWACERNSLACAPDKRSLSWSIGSGALNAIEVNTHLHGIEEMQLTERLGVARRESREGSAGLVEVLVDDDAGTVAERRALLDWRLDIREAETVEFQVVDQRRMAESHKKVGVQVKAIACQSRLFRNA